MTKQVRLMTAAEVADVFRVHVRTVWRWHQAGRLAAAGIGTRRTRSHEVKFVAADIKRYVASGAGQ
jgi:excisionase family DNA binding protein